MRKMNETASKDWQDDIHKVENIKWEYWRLIKQERKYKI